MGYCCCYGCGIGGAFSPWIVSDGGPSRYPIIRKQGIAQKTDLLGTLAAVEGLFTLSTEVVVVGLVLLALLLVWPGLVALMALIPKVVLVLHVVEAGGLHPEAALAAVALVQSALATQDAVSRGLAMLVESLPSAREHLAAGAALVLVACRMHVFLLDFGYWLGLRIVVLIAG